MANQFWITERTGGVYMWHEGTRDDVMAYCAKDNAQDAGGSTDILSGPFNSEAEVRAEFDRLSNHISSSLGIEDWAGQSDIIQCGSYGRGDARMIAWERDDGTRAIETNGNPIWEGEEGFEAAWELCTTQVSSISGTK